MIFRQLEVIVLYKPAEAAGHGYGPAPLTGATAEILSDTKTFTADYDESRRLYTFDDLSPGGAELRVNHPYYVELRQPIQVHPKPTQIAVMLHRTDQPRIFKGCNFIPYTSESERLGIIPEPDVSRAKMISLFHAHELEPESELTDTAQPVIVKHSGVDLRSLREDGMVRMAGPLFHRMSVGFSILTHQLIVRFRPDIYRDEVEQLLENRARRRLPFAPNLFLVDADVGADTDEINSIALVLMESGRLIYVEPHLAESAGPDGEGSFLWRAAWDRHLVGAEVAWKHLAEEHGDGQYGGDPEVKLAVVDLGIPSMNGAAVHPEFRDRAGQPSKVAWFYDYNRQRPDNDRTTSIHGSQCAAVAAGQLTGVAPNCRLISLVYPNGRQEDILEMYHDSAVPIKGERREPADIFSTSSNLGCGQLLSEVNKDLFDHLTRLGRGGKGCLFFFSAGNHGHDIVTGRPFGWYERTFSCAASTVDGNGVEEHTAYSGWGAVDWCSPSSREWDDDDGAGDLSNRPVVTAAALGRGRLPSRPRVATTLLKEARQGDNAICVARVEGFVERANVLLEIPGSPEQEIVGIRRTVPGQRMIKLQSTLRYDHPVGSLVSSGTELLAPTPRSQGPALDVVALWPTSEDGPNLLTGVIPEDDDRAVVLTTSHHDADFGGTSSATALSAGIAALVLSANRDLTWVEVREILRRTAVKIDLDGGDWLDVNGVPWQQGTGEAFWSPRYGFGRLDAGAAVALALSYHTQRPDLMIRGAPGDDGTTPTAPDAESPDIWVRRQVPSADPQAVSGVHQAPTTVDGSDHWIYGRVRNRGAVRSLDAWVRFSIAHPKDSSFEYPLDWDFLNGVGNRSSQDWLPGTYWIGEVGLSRLPAGGDMIVHVRWPAALIPPWERACLLVEITPHDGPSGSRFIYENSNLAQRTISIDHQ